MAFDTPIWLANSPHRPPNDNVGDENPADLYAAMGFLAHRWEGVELALSVLFAQLIGAKTVGALRAFGAVIGSGSRCDMIDAAASAASWTTNDENILLEIKNITSVAKRLAGLRNTVLHGIVASDCGDFFTIFQNPQPTGAYFIMPAIYNTSKTTDRGLPKIWYNASTIGMISETMERLGLHILTWRLPPDPNAIPDGPEGWKLQIAKHGKAFD